MTLEHLPQLDSIASAAAGKPTRVYVDNALPLHIRGLANYDASSRCYHVHLNEALFGWLSDELVSTFYHEVSHVKLNHVNTKIKLLDSMVAYLKVIETTPQTHDEAYPTVGQQRREEEAEAEAARLRRIWPFACYPLWNLITGKETYP